MTNLLNVFLNQYDSEPTKKAYKVDIEMCLEEVGKNEEEIQQIDLTMWKNGLKRYKPATQERKIRSLNSYIKFLSENDIITLKQLDGVKVDYKKQDRDALTFEESKAILELCDTRTKCIIAVALQTGLRKSEIFNLELADVLSGNDITLYGKGDKENTIRLSDNTRGLIEDYLKVRPKNANTTKLFVSNKKNQMSKINETLKKYCDMAGYKDRHITIHSFRRTAVTEVIKRGGIYVAKSFANHGDIRTTIRYDVSDKSDTLKLMENLL